MKIRIFALAKELGLDSKELIEYCHQAGIQLKNSALASISPEERDTVVDYIKQNAGRGGAASPTREESMKPVRAQPRNVKSKVRDIRKSASARSAGQRRSRASGSSTEEAGNVATVEPPATEEESESEIAEPETTPAESAGTERRDSTEESAPSRGETAGREETGDTSQSATAEGAPAEAGERTAEEERSKPIRKEDYVPAPGTSGSSIREMKPRGTIPESESRHAQRSKSKTKPSMPHIAAPPSYKPPKPKAPKKEEERAQKPDIPLTAEALEQQSPLRAHMQQQKKKRRKTGEAEPMELAEEARRGGKTGTVEGKRRQRRKPRRMREDDQPAHARRRTTLRRRRTKSATRPVLKTSAQVETPISVRSLSESMGRPARDIMRILFQQGRMVTINESLTEEEALEIGVELGVDLDIKRPRDIEEELLEALEREDPAESLRPRAPVITILGHVDHGKTTLLDKVRSENVAGVEAGGITQHIAAYQVEHNGQTVTFVDTPGHAAFGEMRARGADVTDIVVLVVAADDGVMPQTVECISHARSAGVPIVVALNKIDLPDANEQKALQDLASRELLPVEWGGETEVIRTSGVSGEGLDDLLETILVTAELHEYKANPDRPALGVCLEAFRDPGRGPLAWMIVQKGVLRLGDVVLCGPSYGRVRALFNDRDEEIEEAGPSTPVKVAGLDDLPAPGDHLFVLEDIEEAREAAETRRDRGRTEILAQRQRPRTLEDILGAAREGAVQELPLIIKADTPGSLEAIRSELQKLEHPEVRVNIVHEGVGGVNESDVYLASTSGAIIIAFQVIPEDRARELAGKEGVEVRRYSVIYEVADSIKRALEGLLEPDRVEVATGRAVVLKTFSISRVGTVAGCRILNGNIQRNNRVRVIRDQTVLNDYPIASLKREKDDVREVREGMECGIRLQGFNDVKEGDLLEAYRIEEVQRTLD